jgi:hypothetical protein
LFLCQGTQKAEEKRSSQTYLYKYLALFNFGILIKTGRTALDLEYTTMENGPVPNEIYQNRHNYETELFKFIPQKDKKAIVVKIRGRNQISITSQKQRLKK